MGVGDFNGDSRSDLAVANFDSGNVSVLLGNGDGIFQAAQGFSAGTNPFSVAVGDFNGDSRPDLAVTNLDSDNVSVLLGNGDGTLQEARNFAAGRPSAVAVVDVNGDGHLDLAVTDSGRVRVLLGNGDGSFQTTHVSYVISGLSQGVAVADFNGDGLPDAATANHTSNNVSILLNDGIWGGGPPVLEAIGDRSVPASQHEVVVPLSAADPDGDPLTFSAVVESLAEALDQERGLFSDGNFWENYGGRQEKWLQGASDQWYFLLPNGELHQWDGGGGAAGNLVGIPGAGYHAQPELLFQAQAARDLDLSLGLRFTGDFFQNYGGQQERWLLGAEDAWYFLLPTGELYRWDGAEGQASGALVASLGAAYYARPQFLYDAASGQLLATPSFAGATLSLDRYDGFVGSFVVTVTVSDGLLSDSETFAVTVTS